MDNVLDDLVNALQVGDDKYTAGMKNMLIALKLMRNPGVLHIEDLSAVFKSVTFNHGAPSTILMSPKALKDITKTFEQ